MAHPHLLSPQDTSAAQELIEASFIHIFNHPDTESNNPHELIASGDCMIVGDAIQTAASELGILTSQELHFGHIVTAFAASDKLPTSKDPILCFTWGQFLPQIQRDQLPAKSPVPYFGERMGIKPLVGSSTTQKNFNYLRAYAPASLIAKVEAVAPDGHHEVVLKGNHYKRKLQAFQAIGKHYAKH